MVTEDFFKKFLPNYEYRHRVYVLERGNFETSDQTLDFYDANMREALQCFLEQACRAQKESIIEEFLFSKMDDVARGIRAQDIPSIEHLSECKY